MLRFIAAAAAIALMVPGVASAGIVATVSAGYDPVLQDAYFTITNTSSDAETGLLLTTDFGPTTSRSLCDYLATGCSLAAGQSVTYDFDQPNGGFIVGAGENNLDDGTTYQLTLTIDGMTLSSNVFSTANNSSGGYVDFLGNTCFGFSNGCLVATSGLVATTAAPAAVPEPSAPAAVALGLGVLAIGAVRRRAL